MSQPASSAPEDASTATVTPAPAIGKSLVRGSLWMIAGRWVMRMIGLVSTVVLARILSPADFGLIAMVMLVYGLLETVSYAGVDMALMRAGHDGRAYYDTAWTVQVLQGLFIAGCLVASAPWIASYFNEPRAWSVVLWVAPRAVIDSLQNIGVVAFRKELDFAKEFRFNLYLKLLGFVVVVGTALWLRNYWALVFGTLFASVAGVVVSYLMHPYRPRLSLARIREIWSFSQWLMISRVGTFLNRKCDEFIVGGAAGATAMGSYHVANELATLPSNEVVMPIRRAMFPTLSKLEDRPEEFSQAVLSSFSAVSAACLFIAFCLQALAPEVVAVVLGSKWSDAVVVMRWMALFGGFSALVLVLEMPLWVMGKTHVSAIQAWVELALLVPTLWWAVQAGGVEGAAATRAAVAVLMVPLMMALTARTGSVSFRQLLLAVWRPLAAALGMALIVVALPAWPAWPALVLLCLKGALCLILYPALLWSLWMASGRPVGAEASAVAALTRRLSGRKPT